MQIDPAEKSKEVTGPRANNYGVASNVPPDNPSKVVNMVDVEDIQVRPTPLRHCPPASAVHCMPSSPSSAKQKRLVAAA